MNAAVRAWADFLGFEHLAGQALLDAVTSATRAAPLPSCLPYLQSALWFVDRPDHERKRLDESVAIWLGARGVTGRMYHAALGAAVIREAIRRRPR